MAIAGSSTEDVKLFGPLHTYVAPRTVGALKLIGLPEQTGEFTVKLGVDGVATTLIVTLPVMVVAHAPPPAVITV